MQRKTPAAKYDVEVITADDLWAQYGPKLPDSNTTPAAQQSPHHWHRWGVWCAGTLFTLSLHTLLFSTMLLGTVGRPPLKPLTEGAAASSQNDNASEFVSVLLIINDNSITPPDQAADESAYEAQQTLENLTKEVVILATVDPVKTPEVGGSTDGKDENAPTAEAAGNEAGRALLFGRYMGQIKARIERTWEYPTTPLPEKFECKVQIKQNAHGEVQEVTLQRCGDDPAWQVSLVQAIQSASPLSAPPDESVFTDIVTISFAARPAALSTTSTANEPSVMNTPL